MDTCFGREAPSLQPLTHCAPAHVTFAPGTGKNEIRVLRISPFLEFTEKLHCLHRKPNTMLDPTLHAVSRNRPIRGLEVDLLPARTNYLLGSTPTQEQKAESKFGEGMGLGCGIESLHESGEALDGHRFVGLDLATCIVDQDPSSRNSVPVHYLPVASPVKKHFQMRAAMLCRNRMKRIDLRKQLSEILSPYIDEWSLPNFRKNIVAQHRLAVLGRGLCDRRLSLPKPFTTNILERCGLCCRNGCLGLLVSNVVPRMNASLDQPYSCAMHVSSCRQPNFWERSECVGLRFARQSESIVPDLVSARRDIQRQAASIGYLDGLAVRLLVFHIPVGQRTTERVGLAEPMQLAELCKQRNRGACGHLGGGAMWDTGSVCPQLYPHTPWISTNAVGRPRTKYPPLLCFYWVFTALLDDAGRRHTGMFMIS